MLQYSHFIKSEFTKQKAHCISVCCRPHPFAHIREPTKAQSSSTLHCSNGRCPNIFFPPKKLLSTAILAYPRISSSYWATLSTETPPSTILSVSRAASRSAVTAPTPPHGDMAWIASPSTVTRSEASHGRRSGTAEHTLSVDDCATSCNSSRARVEGSHSSVSLSDSAADSWLLSRERSLVCASKTSVREMSTQ